MRFFKFGFSVGVSKFFKKMYVFKYIKRVFINFFGKNCKYGIEVIYVFFDCMFMIFNRDFIFIFRCLKYGI